MTRPLTPLEADLMRLLHHARGCDGMRCATCRHIDLRLADGATHAHDDPGIRFDAVDSGLLAMGRQIERVYSLLEGAPVPASLRRSVHQLTEWVDKIRQVMRLPVTAADSEGPPPLELDKPLSVRRKPPRTPVIGGVALPAEMFRRKSG